MSDKIQDSKNEKQAPKKPEELNQEDLDKAVGGWPSPGSSPITVTNPKK